jgi:hypothetical protein
MTPLAVGSRPPENVLWLAASEFVLGKGVGIVDGDRGEFTAQHTEIFMQSGRRWPQISRLVWVVLESAK